MTRRPLKRGYVAPTGDHAHLVDLISGVKVNDHLRDKAAELHLAKRRAALRKKVRK